LEAAPAEHVEAILAVALVAPSAPLAAALVELALRFGLLELLLLRSLRLVGISLGPTARHACEHEAERPQRHFERSCHSPDVPDDDRAVREKLAALEAEVKADADAQRARKDAALAKVREDRAKQQAESNDLRQRQAALVARKKPAPTREPEDM